MELYKFVQELDQNALDEQRLALQELIDNGSAERRPLEGIMCLLNNLSDMHRLLQLDPVWYEEFWSMQDLYDAIDAVCEDADEYQITKEDMEKLKAAAEQEDTIKNLTARCTALEDLAERVVFGREE